MLELFSFEAAVPVHLFEYQLPGRRTAQHWHSFYEIGFCTSGAGLFYVGDQAIPISAGDLLLFPPFSAHIAQAVGEEACVCSFVYFSETLFQEEDRHLLHAFYRNEIYKEREVAGFVPELPSLGASIAALLEEYERKRTHYGPLLRARLLELCITLQRALERKEMPGGHRGDWQAKRSALSQLKPALDYIAVHFRESLELDDLAAALSLSASRARHLFKAGTGKRFKEYLTFVRIQEAKRLLATGEVPVTEVYYACGFQSSAPFYRSFRQLVGQSPLEYREQQFREVSRF